VAEGVELIVQNDGSTLRLNGAKGPGHGVGTATTRARLMTAYGDRASLTLIPRAEGGATVRIVIPRKTSPLPITGAPALQEAT